MTKKEVNKVVNDNFEEIQKLHFQERLDCKAIGKIFGVSNQPILAAFKRRGIKNRKFKYDCDLEYFENIDAPDKAYFLGLMYADGNVNKKKTGFRIELKREDEKILKTFQKCVKSTHPLFYSTRRGREYCYFILTRSKMANDLSNLGCVPKKSLILKFPTEEQVPSHLIHHFIRGYFDGDGCVCNTLKPRFSTRITICSTEEFDLELQKIVLDKINLTSKVVQNESIFVLDINGRKKSVKLLDWLYQDSEGLRLERKYEKYLIAKNFKPRLGISGFYGVYWIPKQNKYRVDCRVEKRRIFLGFFNDPKEGAVKYNQFVIENKLDRPLNFTTPIT